MAHRTLARIEIGSDNACPCFVVTLLVSSLHILHVCSECADLIDLPVVRRCATTTTSDIATCPAGNTDEEHQLRQVRFSSTRPV